MQVTTLPLPHLRNADTLAGALNVDPAELPPLIAAGLTVEDVILAAELTGHEVSTLLA